MPLAPAGQGWISSGRSPMVTSSPSILAQEDEGQVTLHGNAAGQQADHGVLTVALDRRGDQIESSGGR